MPLNHSNSHVSSDIWIVQTTVWWKIDLCGLHLFDPAFLSYDVFHKCNKAGKTLTELRSGVNQTTQKWGWEIILIFDFGPAWTLRLTIHTFPMFLHVTVLYLFSLHWVWSVPGRLWVNQEAWSLSSASCFLMQNLSQYFTHCVYLIDNY